MLHVVKLVWRSHDGAGDAGVTSGSTGEEFEVWPRVVLVTLETVIETSVRFIVILSGDPTQDANLVISI